MSKNSSRPYELSKSQYTKGVTCLKKIWLHNFKRELATPPTDFQEHLFTQGNLVGELARQYFAGGVLIAEGRDEAIEAVTKTEAAIKNKTRFIFEGAFIFEKILVRVDILKNNGDSTFDLIEVKSTNSVKDHHLDDVAVQKYVLAKLGYKIRDTYLMHLNGDYVREGEINLTKLFTLALVNDGLAHKLDAVPNELKMIRATLADKKEPEQSIGSVCKNPYPCEFQKHCWSHITANSIHKIARISDDKRAKLLDLGIEEIKNIPENFKLSELQAIQVKVAKENDVHLELKQIKEHLKDLEYPLYFLDYETIGYAIPQFDGTSPYEQFPFQYSVHIQKVPGGPLEHHEYLNKDVGDPRRAFAESLCSKIGERGTVIVYHASFERSKTEALAKAFVDLQTKLESLVHRMWDLETPFAKKWYYDHQFQGSSSIKFVLPVFAPELSYNDLSIQKGDTAAIRYNQMIELPTGTEKAKIYTDLLKYCERDSLAMAKILGELSELINPSQNSKNAVS
jgi:hypothetical protein